MKLQAKRGEIGVSAYRKDLEMLEKNVISTTESPGGITRVELFLRRAKLIAYLGKNDNTQEIDEQRRLVRFRPDDIIAAHRRAMSELQGVFFKLPNGKKKSKLSKFIAYNSKHHGIPLPDLLSSYESLNSPSKRVMGNLRRDAYAYAGEISPLTMDSLTLDQAYASSIMTRDSAMRREWIRDFEWFDRDIYEAYGPPVANDTASEINAQSA